MAVVLLMIFAIHRHLVLRAPIGVENYFQRIRIAANDAPWQIEGWIGQDVPMPVQALNTLQPDVVVSRRYTNVETGSVAGVLLVHCVDAHQMVGHFPSRCYPAQGWHLDDLLPRDWNVGNIELHCNEFHFSKNDLDAAGSIVVINCMLRPGGAVLRDMNALSRSVVGAYGPRMGAGQLQIYFDTSVPREQRDAAVTSLVTGFTPALRAILEISPKNAIATDVNANSSRVATPVVLVRP